MKIRMDQPERTVWAEESSRGALLKAQEEHLTAGGGAGGQDADLGVHLPLPGCCVPSCSSAPSQLLAPRRPC